MNLAAAARQAICGRLPGSSLGVARASFSDSAGCHRRGLAAFAYSRVDAIEVGGRARETFESTSIHVDPGPGASTRTATICA